jgi:glycosyltransferase involved in cell wall biosynthesis
MKTLFVALANPWPPTSGARQRMAAILQLMADRGDDIDLVIFGKPEPDAAAIAAANLPVHRVFTIERHAMPVTGHSWSSPLPRSHLGVDWDRAAGDLQACDLATYDVLWACQSAGYLLVRGASLARRMVVDLYDIEWVIRRQIHVSSGTGRAGLSARALRQRASVEADLLRWRGLYRSIGEDATTVVVCSEEDRSQLPPCSSAVLPNGYWTPHPPAWRGPGPEAPTILFQGLLSYRPNIDAVTELLCDIRPRVLEELPDARFRVVGRYSEALEPLRDLPAVDMTGYVDNLEDELRRASLLAAPVRSGSGTNLKVIEALAHGIPVVTTSTGARGLDLRSGETALIADDVDAFACEIVRVCRDPSLATRLSDAGMEHFATRFDWRLGADRLDDVITGRSLAPRQPGA